MANDYFSFKQFTIHQGRSAFKVGTDAVILGAAADVSGADKILDIGTGTGIVAIMLAQRCKGHITAIEPDEGSFADAGLNVSDCPWNRRITLVNTSLGQYDPGETKFDLIVSNPPYFTGSLKGPDERKNASRHSDSLPQDEILIFSGKFLSEKGKLQVIMPYAEGNVFIATAATCGLFCSDILKIRPLPSSEIRRIVMTFERTRKKAAERFLTIEHGPRHEFTEEYKNLTRDFYLKF